MQVPFPGVDRSTALIIWEKHQPFPIRPWVDLPSVCELSTCLAFYFPDCRNYFCLLLVLSQLIIYQIPHSGYISPEAMVELLSALSSLEILSLEFQSPQSRPDRESRPLPPPKHSVLPVLHQFNSKGVTEYLEELLTRTRIGHNKLDEMDIAFFNQIDFDCSRLAQLISRTPAFRALDEAQVQF